MTQMQIEDYFGLVSSIARKFKTVPFDDAFQSGCEGLVVASKRYKEGETPFVAFASRYIYGYIYNSITSTQAIRKPQRILALNKKIKDLKKQGIIEPCDISKKLGVPLKKVEEAIVLYDDFLPLIDDEDGDCGIKDDYNLEEEVEKTLEFERVMEQINLLSKKQKDIILQRFYYDKTQAEVAKEKDRTRQAIQFTEKKAMSILRKSLGVN